MNQGLRAEAVSFQYPQNQTGFGPYSLSVRQGESVLVSGLSGSGKSTLARCLTGIIPHLYRGSFHGQVWIDDLRTDQTPLWKLSEKIGFVFQNPALQMLASTVEEEILFGLENLGLPRCEMSNRLEEALDTFRLEDMRLRSPMTLSGGEQQKLALASVMARKPEILVLDEPLSMLDSTSATAFVSGLQDQVCTGISMVILEHREGYLRSLPGLRVECLNGHPLPQTSFRDWEQADGVPARTLNIEHLKVERGKKRIIDDLSFRLESGRLTGLVGPNGAGKTTLFRTLTGFQAYQGKIELTGSGSPPQFGMVFQNPDVQLFNATVREEILYQVSHPDMEWYGWLLGMLDLERYEKTPPLLLSEGEKRRVALATILMRRPGSGILLDEPTLGLDGVHKTILLRLLRSLAKQGMFVLFSTHDLEMAAQADDLILIGEGGIAAQGETKQILQNERAWAEIGLVLPAWMDGRA